MLKIFVVLKRGIFKDLKKKSSGFQSRNPFPILYLREYVPSLDQFGGDILIYFIYLFLSYDKKSQTFTSQHITWNYVDGLSSIFPS